MKNSRPRDKKEALTRRSGQSLDHTVSSPRRRSGEPSTVRPLMRTVLGDTTAGRSRPSSVVSFPKLIPSPARAVRASNRSEGRAARSPFLNATLHTPEITQRAFECARRHIRREVLFATDQRRKGAGGGRRKQSKWRC